MGTTDACFLLSHPMARHMKLRDRIARENFLMAGAVTLLQRKFRSGRQEKKVAESLNDKIEEKKDSPLDHYDYEQQQQQQQQQQGEGEEEGGEGEAEHVTEHKGNIEGNIEVRAAMQVVRVSGAYAARARQYTNSSIFEVVRERQRILHERQRAVLMRLGKGRRRARSSARSANTFSVVKIVRRKRRSGSTRSICVCVP